MTNKAQTKSWKEMDADEKWVHSWTMNTADMVDASFIESMAAQSASKKDKSKKSKGRK